MTHWSTTPAQLISFIRRSAAAAGAGLRPGQKAHGRAFVLGLVPHSTLETDILLMYARCGRLPLARLVFDQMPNRPLHSWNILCSSYAQSSLFLNALALLHPLLSSGLHPDHFTLPSLLKASAGLRQCRTGAALHVWAIRLSLDIHVIVYGSLIDMYMKCGCLLDACELFDKMRERDEVVCNVMITGFVKAGMFNQALNLFRRIQKENIGKDWMAVPSIISACGQTADLRRGKEVHGKSIRYLVIDCDVAIGNSLIELYAKCGCLDASSQVFARMRRRNLVTWSTLISCYGMHGQAKEALKLYDEMRAQGLEPNNIVFTSVLASCSHSGLVDEGRAVFDSMYREYGLEPGIEHYACMVDLLGRYGSISEALELIGMMEMEPVPSIWGALLAACSFHRNVEVGEIVARRLFELEPENSSNNVALCAIYEKAGNWEGVAEMRKKLRELGVVKNPGCSWIEVKGRMLSFNKGDASPSYPLSKKMMQVIRGLLGQPQFQPLDEV